MKEAFKQFWSNDKKPTNQAIVTLLEYALTEVKKVRKDSMADSVSFTHKVGDREITITIKAK